MTVSLPQPEPDRDHRRRIREGLALTLAAFLLWGFNPFYFKSVADIPPVEVLAHRVLWSVVLLVPFYLAVRRPWPFRLLRDDARLLRMLLASTTIMAANWLIYIYAVGSDQVLQASLGYYITPALVGGPNDQMISYMITYHLNEVVNWGMASALGALLLLATLILLALLGRLIAAGPLLRRR